MNIRALLLGIFVGVIAPITVRDPGWPIEAARSIMASLVDYATSDFRPHYVVTFDSTNLVVHWRDGNPVTRALHWSANTDWYPCNDTFFMAGWRGAKPGSVRVINAWVTQWDGDVNLQIECPSKDA